MIQNFACSLPKLAAKKSSAVIFLLVVTFFATSTCAAQTTEHWVGAWAAAPRNLIVPAAAQDLKDTTYRNIVHLTMGGNRFRVQLTNEFGADPLKIEGAHVAISLGNGAIDATTDVRLTFNGSPSVVIPDGAIVVSDPISIEAKAFANLAISVFLPSQNVKVMTVHPLANATTYMLSGDALSTPHPASMKQLHSWYFVKGIEVSAAPDATAIVTLGDSITDGRSSTLDANSRWPDVLATRLQQDKRTKNISVLNEGISGNRILHDVDGPSALARFDRDVLSQPGCKYLVILEGINDIGKTDVPQYPGQGVTPADLIFGLNQLVLRAHAHGIKVFGGTLTPYEGAAYFTSAGEKQREALNAWIRTGGVFDGVIDFDKAVRDPSHPTRILPAFDDGHHLHPNDAGYKAMGSAIDLQLLQ